MKHLSITVLCSVLAGVATPVLAATNDGYHAHMWDGYGMGHGFFGFGFMLIFWIAVIALIVFAVRAFTQPDTFGKKGDDALEILRQRLAKGEIDAEEYAARKKALEE